MRRAVGYFRNRQLSYYSHIKRMIAPIVIYSLKSIRIFVKLEVDKNKGYMFPFGYLSTVGMKKEMRTVSITLNLSLNGMHGTKR